MTEALSTSADAEPTAIRCRACPWLQVGTNHLQVKPDEAQAKDRATVNYALSQAWRKTSILCPQCKGRMMERRRPKARSPLEVRCADCGFGLYQKPA